MSDFRTAIKTVLSHEGGYVNDLDDPGGETKFGISKRSYPDLHIVSLSWTQAANIYERDWWNKYEYWRINEQDIATKILDLSINMGARQAHKIVQRALLACGKSLSVDGILGPITFSAINSIPEFILLPAIRSEAAGYYRLLIALDPVRKKYEKGWLKRAYS